MAVQAELGGIRGGSRQQLSQPGAALSRTFSSAAKVGEEDSDHDDYSKSSRSVKRRIARRPAHAPATWLETISTLSETLRFTYSETFRKWPIKDLAFGINYHMRRQGMCGVAYI